ncbi:MAG: alpha/beta hydrolase [Pseudomonadales bacterium]|nr:alpha/beta hydrolase [Pseudomonadales bacterium]
MKLIADEFHLQVNGLSYAAQRWRHVLPGDAESELRPVLCLHGWLDNSESFARLAPLMVGCEVVAIDMAGHGETSHRAAHARYDIYDDLEDINDIADALGWQQFSLLGHSRGAGIALLYTTVMPERISSLVLLDGIAPPPGQQRNFVEQLRAHILERRTLRYKTGRPYASIERALEKRLQMTALSADEARDMVARDLIKNDEGYAWRHDWRLHGASAVRLKPEQVADLLDTLAKPALLLVANHGMVQKHGLPAQVSEHPQITLRRHDGRHHFHLQREHVPGLAAIINAWFAEH